MARWLLCAASLAAARADDAPCALTSKTLANIRAWVQEGRDPGGDAFDALRFGRVEMASVGLRCAADDASSPTPQK